MKVLKKMLVVSLLILVGCATSQVNQVQPSSAGGTKQVEYVLTVLSALSGELVISYEFAGESKEYKAIGLIFEDSGDGYSTLEMDLKRISHLSHSEIREEMIKLNGFFEDLSIFVLFGEISEHERVTFSGTFELLSEYEKNVSKLLAEKCRENAKISTKRCKTHCGVKDCPGKKP